MNTTENDGELVTSKDVVKALFKEYGGHKAVAGRFDFSLARAYSFTDPAFPEHNLSFKRVAQLTTPQSTAAAQHLAQLAGAVLQPIAAAKPVSPMVALSEAMRECGEASASAVMALSDGEITPDEAPRILKEIDEAVAALMKLRGIVAATDKVVSIRQ